MVSVKIVIILNFIFELFIEIKIGEKQFRALKKFLPDFRFQVFAHSEIIASIFIGLKI